LIRIVLPFAAFVVFFLLSLGTVRLLRPAQPRRFFLGYAALMLAASALVYLRRWPLARVDDAIGLLACLAVQLVLCLTFWNSFYSLLWGFSGGLMYDLFNDPTLRNTDRLVRSYQGDGAVDRIMARRLPNLAAGGYIEQRGDMLRLRPKGRFIASATMASFKAFSLGMGGGIKE
jgi:hypothetical protein